jgi:hypothetical protein
VLAEARRAAKSNAAVPYFKIGRPQHALDYYLAVSAEGKP